MILGFNKKESEEEIVKAFNDYRTAVDAGNRPPQIVGGIIFKSEISEDEDFQYQIRWGAEGPKNPFSYGDEMEVQTGDLFSPTIIPQGTDFSSCSEYSKSYAANCVEIKYQLFVMLQSMVDNAYIREVTGDPAFLPTSEEELCNAEMVWT